MCTYKLYFCVIYIGVTFSDLHYYINKPRYDDNWQNGADLRLGLADRYRKSTAALKIILECGKYKPLGCYGLSIPMC